MARLGKQFGYGTRFRLQLIEFSTVCYAA